MRIGSDALRTAEAIEANAVASGARTPPGSRTGRSTLVRSPSHAAAHALFTLPDVRLAVARGSGPTTRLLGAIATQHGIPASLHGTGGAWMYLADDAPADRARSAIIGSLDRKVCNTLNTLVVAARQRARARPARRSTRSPSAIRRSACTSPPAPSRRPARAVRAARQRPARGRRHRRAAGRRHPRRRARDASGSGKARRSSASCARGRRRGDRSDQPLQPALRRIDHHRRSPSASSGSTTASTRRTSATASRAGSTASGHGTAPSSACRTGSAGASSDVLESCRGTTSSRSATSSGMGPGDATQRR